MNPFYEHVGQSQFAADMLMKNAAYSIAEVLGKSKLRNVGQLIDLANGYSVIFDVGRHGTLRLDFLMSYRSEEPPSPK